MPLLLTRWAKRQIQPPATATIFQDLYGINRWLFGSRDWQFSRLIEWGNIQYLGVDVSGKL